MGENWLQKQHINVLRQEGAVRVDRRERCRGYFTWNLQHLHQEKPPVLPGTVSLLDAFYVKFLLGGHRFDAGGYDDVLLELKAILPVCFGSTYSVAGLWL